MTSHPELRIGERTIALLPGETVLDGCLRSGLAIPHSCKAGICQTCLMRLGSACDSGNGEESQQVIQTGLNETLRSQGYFLSCQTVPKRI